MRRHFILSILAVFPLAGCVQYRDNTDRIGSVMPLQSLRQLQGTYASVPVPHNGLPEPRPGDSLASRFGLTQSTYDGLWLHTADPSATVRITYLNDQQFLTEGFDASGRLVAQKTQAVSPQFVFGADGLCEARTGWGDSTSVHSGTISNCFTLSQKGNLLHRQAIRATGNVIPAIKHTTDYLEYTRLQ